MNGHCQQVNPIIYPTHTHADGGMYQFMFVCEIKHDLSGDWVSGVVYRDVNGQFYATSLERWSARFEEIRHARGR